MKYRALIKQEVSGREYSAEFDSVEERQEYVDRVLAKKVVGLGEREILKSTLKPELADRVIATTTKQVTVIYFDEETGEEVETVEDREYVTVKSDFVVELSERSDAIEKRKAEYPTVEEVLHIILDHGLDSEEMLAMQELRASIKAKYPKE